MTQPDPHIVSRFVAKQIVKSAKKGAPAVEDLAKAISEIELETQILGASFIKVTVIDPDWALITSGWLNVVEGLVDQIEVEFPEKSGWFWRLCAIDGSTDRTQANLTLTFEDRIVAYMREYWGPKTAPPGTSTRAQFIRDLVREVGHKGERPIDFRCKAINKVQPIEPSAEEKTEGLKTAAAKDASEAKANKAPGLNAGSPATVKGQKLNAQQVVEANTLSSTADGLNAPLVAKEALMFAAIAESSLGAGAGAFTPNSLGFYGTLQGNSQTWPDPHDTKGMATSFLLGGKGFQAGGAIALAHSGVTDPIEIAVRVEAPSVWPDNAYASESGYSNFLPEAKQIVSAGGGTAESAAGENVSDVGQLTRGTTDNPDEDNWECSSRLAAQVDWSLFSNGNSLFYMDGPEMLKQRPALHVNVPANRITKANGTVEDGVLQTPLTFTFDNCLALDTPIPTPDGWTTMGALETGDAVFGADGRPVLVDGVSQVHEGRRCYRVCFSDGTSIVADAGHLWETRTERTSLAHAAGGDKRLGIYTTEEIAGTLRGYGPRFPHNHRVKVAEPLDLAERELQINPYILGYWLGDGRAAGPQITVDDADLPHLLREIDAAGYSHRAKQYAGTGFSTKPEWLVTVSPRRPYRRSRRNDDSLTGRLRALDVLDNKHIPAPYLRGSREQRTALLQGLMDSDGTIGRVCCLQLGDRTLALGALELVRSLGFRVRCSDEDPVGAGVKRRYRITFSARDHTGAFRLARKADRYVQRVNRTSRSHCAHRTIVAADPVPSVPVKCIAVSTADHLYLAGEAMIPTHNTQFQYRQTHKVKGKVQRKSRASKPSTPAEVRLPLVCGLEEYRAGDVIEFQHSGPIDGRWIVSNATRNCLKDIFTTLILQPPLEPLPEPKGTPGGEATSAAIGGGVSSVVEAAKRSLTEKSKYEYVYGGGREPGADLFGPAPRRMDCSSWTTLCFKAAGQPDPSGLNYNPIGTTETLINNATKVANPQPGDLCLFGEVGHTTHVTIYVGGGKAISMGAPGDPEEGPAETTGPSGFLGYYRPKT